MDKKEKLITYLKEIYNPVAIVLAGSRASGTFSPTSDWDVYVFSDQKFEWGFDTFEGEAMDMQDNPDTDPQETQEWLDALEGVLKHEGAHRAHFLIEQLEAPSGGGR